MYGLMRDALSPNLKPFDARPVMSLHSRVVMLKTNICIRGGEPSGGVPKFALLSPAPSCASALTASVPAPPWP